MKAQLRLRQLEALKAVTECGSMTRAAEELAISQPAVSRLISDLSNELGFKLLDRREGRLVPTQEARFLLPDIRRVLDLLDLISDVGHNLTQRKAGHLRIACLPGFATSHLPGVMAKFLADRPGVTATIEPDRPERILEWIIGEQYDCGITDAFDGHPAIESETIAIRTVCVFPPDHRLAMRDKVTPGDLADERIIHARRDSQFFRDLSEVFLNEGVNMNPVVEIRQFTAACELVSLGIGVAVVSELDARNYSPEKLQWRPFEPTVPHRLSLVRPVHKHLSAIALEFMEVFRESLEPLRKK